MDLRESSDSFDNTLMSSPLSSPLISFNFPSFEIFNLPVKRTKSSESFGHDPSRFVTPISDDFLCGFCERVVKEPTECSKCGKLFCLMCIRSRRSSFGPETISESIICPNCNSKCELRKLSRVMCRIINELKLSCKNSKRGCEQISSLGDLKIHEENCPSKRVKCGNHRYCTVKGKASDFMTIENTKPISNYSNMIRRSTWHTKMYACCQQCKKMIKFDRSVVSKQSEKALKQYFKLLKQLQEQKEV